MIKTRPNKGVKRKLLSTLTIREYFRVKQLALLDGTIPYLNTYQHEREISIGACFVWHTTIEGINYWAKTSARKRAPNNDILTLFIKWLIIQTPFL